MDQDKDVIVVESNEPTTYDDVLKSSKSELWLKAMESEMDSIYINQVENLIGAGTSVLLRQSKSLISNKIRMNHVFTRRLVGVQLFSWCCM